MGAQHSTSHYHRLSIALSFTTPCRAVFDTVDLFLPDVQVGDDCLLLIPAHLPLPNWAAGTLYTGN